jgi:predicted dehydrogenase
MFGMPGDMRKTDTLDVLAIQFLPDASGSVSVGTACVGGGGHRLELFGSDGALVLENTSEDYMRGFRLYHIRRDDNRRRQLAISDPNEATGGDGRILPVAALSRRFLDWIVDGQPAEPDFGVGLRVQRLLRAAQQSSASGLWLTADEF